MWVVFCLSLFDNLNEWTIQLLHSTLLHSADLFVHVKASEFSYFVIMKESRIEATAGQGERGSCFIQFWQHFVSAKSGRESSGSARLNHARTLVTAKSSASDFQTPLFPLRCSNDGCWYSQEPPWLAIPPLRWCKIVDQIWMFHRWYKPKRSENKYFVMCRTLLIYS